MRALDIRGEWTRDRLLSLTRHMSRIEWGRFGHAIAFLRKYVVEVCRMSEDEILWEKNGVGPSALGAIKKHLEGMGLSLDMRIERFNERAVNRYALYRAGLEPGSDALLEMRLEDLPDGLPMTRVNLSSLNWYCRGHRWPQMTTVRGLSEVLARFGADAINREENGLGDTVARQLLALGFNA